MQKLREHGLEPSDQAARSTLVRRVYLDLIGIPPTPAELDQSVNTQDPEWYTKLVDSLLANPGFGVRWARHWLDLVRFAQSRGHEFDEDIRDDLDDEGAWLYAETIRKVHELNPNTGVEMLAPDFSGHAHLLDQVFETRPEVFAHNVETVPRIFKEIRLAFTYERSLQVITMARDFGLITKSNLILGLGETRSEVSQALTDLHSAGCDLITITQYLRPTNRHHPVERWVKPEEFVELSAQATQIGFLGVMSGPLVRSSYRAGRLYKQAMQARVTNG
jgi:hypothetical protein